MTSFPQAFPPTPCAHLYPPPYVPHALPISFVSILAPAQYWVRSTDHSAPRYAAFEHAITNSKRRTITVLYSFTCSDQRTRSLVTRFASIDTITSTLNTHTNRDESSARQTTTTTPVFLGLLGALLYSATISLPLPSRRLAPLHAAPRSQTGASNPLRGSPTIDRQPRNIGMTLSLSLSCSAFQPFRAPPRRLTSSAYSLIATIQLYLVHIDVKKKIK